MKSLRTTFCMLALMLTAACTFTACDDDDDVGFDIAGTWYGDLQMYYGSEQAIYSEINFKSSGGLFSYKNGTGYEKDYYSHRTITHDFDYEIQDGVIYLTFDDRDLDCRISDYHVTNSRFTGYMSGYGSGQPIYFELEKNKGRYDGRGNGDDDDERGRGDDQGPDGTGDDNNNGNNNGGRRAPSAQTSLPLEFRAVNVDFNTFKTLE